MILHKCDRCGSLSDEGVRARNKYEDWMIVTVTFVNVPYRDTEDYEKKAQELCVTCKREFKYWQENVVREEISNGE